LPERWEKSTSFLDGEFPSIWAVARALACKARHCFIPAVGPPIRNAGNVVGDYARRYAAPSFRMTFPTSIHTGFLP